MTPFPNSSFFLNRNFAARYINQEYGSQELVIWPTQSSCHIPFRHQNTHNIIRKKLTKNDPVVFSGTTPTQYWSS